MALIKKKKKMSQTPLFHAHLNNLSVLPQKDILVPSFRIPIGDHTFIRVEWNGNEKWNGNESSLKVFVFFNKETHSSLCEFNDLELKASFQLKFEDEVIAEDTAYWLLSMGAFQRSLEGELKVGEDQLCDQNCKLYFEVHASSNYQEHIDQVVALFNK